MKKINKKLDLRKEEKSNTDILIMRIKEGEKKTCQEWAELYFPDQHPIMARSSFQSTLSSLKKRKIDPIFLAPTERGGALVEITKAAGNESAVIRAKKFSLGATRNFLKLSERVVDEQPEKESFIGTQLKECMIEMSASLVQLGDTFKAENVKLSESFKKDTLRLSKSFK